MKAHYVELRAFAHATESLELVDEGMRTLIPGDLGVDVEEAEGHFGNRVRILRTKLEKADDIRYFLDRIDHLKSTLLSELDRRLDDDCNLWIRLDKQRAVEGRVEGTDMDGIVARIKLAAYPADRENAVESAEELLG